jgi:hypothetical protein
MPDDHCTCTSRLNKLPLTGFGDWVDVVSVCGRSWTAAATGAPDADRAPPPPSPPQAPAAPSPPAARRGAVCRRCPPCRGRPPARRLPPGRKHLARCLEGRWLGRPAKHRPDRAHPTPVGRPAWARRAGPAAGRHRPRVWGPAVDAGPHRRGGLAADRGAPPPGARVGAAALPHGLDGAAAPAPRGRTGPGRHRPLDQGRLAQDQKTPGDEAPSSASSTSPA